MPNRLIREGFLDSESIAALSESAECFYHRLLLVVDDAGRTDGRPGILRARLYPLGTERGVEDILRLLRECEARGLLLYYTCHDKPYIQLARWQRPGHSVHSKWPWVDGSFRVVWVKRETRDGMKEFVATSLFGGVSRVQGAVVQGVQEGVVSAVVAGVQPTVVEGEPGGAAGFAGHRAGGSLSEPGAPRPLRVAEGEGVGEGSRSVGGGGGFFASAASIPSVSDGDGMGGDRVGMDGIEGDSFQMSGDEDGVGDVHALSHRSGGSLSESVTPLAFGGAGVGGSVPRKAGGGSMVGRDSRPTASEAGGFCADGSQRTAQRSAGPVSGRADPRPPGAAGGVGVLGLHGSGELSSESVVPGGQRVAGPVSESATPRAFGGAGVGGSVPRGAGSPRPHATQGEAPSARRLACSGSTRAGLEAAQGEEVSVGRLDLGEEFLEFWQAYPKKRSRDAAWRVWRSRKPPLARCLVAIAQLRRTEEWRKDGGRFVPHAANWLSAGGWNDVPEVDLRRRPQDGSLTSGASLSDGGAGAGGSAGGAGSLGRPLLPGESAPEPLGDPEVWPDYVALHPVLAGKHLRDLSAGEQESFKDWSFARQREEWERVRK